MPSSARPPETTPIFDSWADVVGRAGPIETPDVKVEFHRTVLSAFWLSWSELTGHHQINHSAAGAVEGVSGHVQVLDRRVLLLRVTETVRRR